MKKKLVPIIGFVGILSIIVILSAYISGPPIGSTNAPGESSCAESVGCHIDTFSVKPGGAEITMHGGVPLAGYIPGKVYTLMPVMMNTGDTILGFQTVAKLANGDNAGSVTITDPLNTKLTPQTSPYLEYVNHTQKGSENPGMHDWMYEWEAPAKGYGTVIIYGAFVSANNDLTQGGDKVYTASLILIEDTSNTSISSREEEIKITRIYPVPSRDFVIMDLSVKNPILVDYSVVDIFGRKVIAEKSILFSPGENSFHLDIKDLNDGTYIIYFKENGQALIMHKIIKAKSH